MVRSNVSIASIILDLSTNSDELSLDTGLFFHLISRFPSLINYSPFHLFVLHVLIGIRMEDSVAAAVAVKRVAEVGRKVPFDS